MALETVIRFLGIDDTTPAAKSAGASVEDTADKASKANEKHKRSVEELNFSWQKFGKELKQVSQFVVGAAGSVVASFSAAVAASRKDVPEVDAQVKKLGNSMQVLSNNMAKAVLPTLKDFNKFVAGLVFAISNFIERNKEFVNSFLKYSAIALAIASVIAIMAKLILVLGKVYKIVITGASLITTLATKFTGWGLIIAAVTALFVIFKDQILDFLKKIPFIGKLIEGVSSTFDKVKDEIDQILKDISNSTAETVQRTQDAIGSFADGVKDTFNSLNTNSRTFGSSISASLEDAFSNTIFNGITGKLHGLRDIINSFKDDVIRAFSKLAANEFLGLIFGDKEGTKKGIFGEGGLANFLNGLLGIFGLGKKGGGKGNSPADKLKEETDKVAEKFTGLAKNMDLFGKSKDRLMDNFDRFSSKLENRDNIGTGIFSNTGLSTGSQGGGLPFPGSGVPFPGGGQSPVPAISGDAVESTKKMAQGLTAITGAAGLAATAIIGIGAAHQEAGKQFLISTAIGLAASLGALAIAVAAGAAAAAALAAAWAPAATLASIATFGGAAAAGAGSVTTAVGANQAFVSQQSQQALGNAAGIKFGLSSLPKLAEGGIALGPTLAMIGEGKEPEVVAPLSKLPDLIQSTDSGAGSKIEINLNIAEAKLNTPSNMREFVQGLSVELGYLVKKGVGRARTANG